MAKGRKIKELQNVYKQWTIPPGVNLDIFKLFIDKYNMLLAKRQINLDNFGLPAISVATNDKAFRRAIAPFPEDAQQYCLERFRQYHSEHMELMSLKRKAYDSTGVKPPTDATKDNVWDATTSYAVLMTIRRQVLDLFGKWYTIAEVYTMLVNEMV